MTAAAMIEYIWSVSRCRVVGPGDIERFLQTYIVWVCFMDVQNLPQGEATLTLLPAVHAVRWRAGVLRAAQCCRACGQDLPQC